MKKNLFKAVAFIGYLMLVTAPLHAMLPLLPESVITKGEQTLQLRPAKTKEEIQQAVSFIKKRFSSVRHDDQYQEICAYLTTSEGPVLVGAANFLILTPARPYIHLANIVVDKKIQNEGIGTALLAYLLRNAPAPIQLYSINEGTTRLYEKHGFYSYDEKNPGKMQRDYPYIHGNSVQL